MTIDEKLVEECALAMDPSSWTPAHYAGRQELLEKRKEAARRKARAAIPLIQKEMLERMMEPDFETVKAQKAALKSLRAESECDLRIFHRAMLRTFASEIGIDIE